MFAELLDPEKLATQGSTYVMAVMLVVGIVGMTAMMKYYRADSRESQSNYMASISASQEKFITALGKLETTQRETAHEITAELASVKQAVQGCRYAGLIDDAGKRALPQRT